ncbi:MAG: hypothetical protein HZY73_02500 [Micropruina sp.]|nr:MAG: hypothetical protein HZY73_02500 [Micropruina sp.]
MEPTPACCGSTCRSGRSSRPWSDWPPGCIGWWRGPWSNPPPPCSTPRTCGCCRGVALGRIAETGQWVLRAPGWQPMVPVDQESEAAEDELPLDFATTVLPFRRGAVLAPQFTVVRRRHPFHLVDAEQRVLGS